VGDPPSTYSTILTPRPPVESRGLQISGGVWNLWLFFENSSELTSKSRHCHPDSNRLAVGTHAETTKSHHPEWTKSSHATPGAPCYAVAVEPARKNESVTINTINQPSTNPPWLTNAPPLLPILVSPPLGFSQSFFVAEVVIYRFSSQEIKHEIKRRRKAAALWLVMWMQFFFIFYDWFNLVRECWVQQLLLFEIVFSTQYHFAVDIIIMIINGFRGERKVFAWFWFWRSDAPSSQHWRSLFHGENVEPEKNWKIHGNSSLTGNKTTNRPQSSQKFFRTQWMMIWSLEKLWQICDKHKRKAPPPRIVGVLTNLQLNLS
jgi:hypothetical protein